MLATCRASWTILLAASAKWDKVGHPAGPQVKDPKCNLCNGTGDNQTGVTMRVNNDICPRCGGYGTVPISAGNVKTLTDQDRGYIANNGGQA